MDLGLGGKVVVLAGGTRGIGRAAASVFAEEGARLVLAARGEEGLRSAAAELSAAAPQGPGAEVETVAVDLFVPGGPEALIDRALARFGTIDVLVNVAGGSSGGRFEDNSVADFEEGMARNFWPALRASKAALPALLEAKGVVIHVGSIWGVEGGGLISYNAAKAALTSLTKAMGRELAPRGVRVVCIAPGSVLHPGGSWERRLKADPAGIARFVQAEIPAGRFGTPREIAEVIAFAASERAGWLTATTVVVDGGQTRSF